MPSKKKKYNARFPAGRIKKIMQTDEEVGKVAQAVPVIISRTLELFVESLLTKTLRITNARNAKTLSPSHMKQCIMSESRFDFLRELVKNVPDINVSEENALECSSPGPSCDNNSSTSAPSSPPQFPLNGSLATAHFAMNGTETDKYRSHAFMNQGGVGSSCSSSSSSHHNDQYNFNQLPRTSSTVIQHVGRPPKLARFDSAPSSLSSSSICTTYTPNNNFKFEISPNINTPTMSSYDHPVFKIDLSKTTLTQNMEDTHITTPIPKVGNVAGGSGSDGCGNSSIGFVSGSGTHSSIPDLTPIVKIDLSNAFDYPPTSNTIDTPTPPVIQMQNDVSSPIVKIDYSKYAFNSEYSSYLSAQYDVVQSSMPSSCTEHLPSSSSASISMIGVGGSGGGCVSINATPLQKKSLNLARQTSTNVGRNETTQSSQPPPLINIDLSNLNNRNNFMMSTPSMATNSTSTGLELDEDYDNI